MPGPLAALAIQYGPSLMKHSGTLKAGYDWLFGKGAPGRAGSMSPHEQKYLNFMQSRAKTGLGQGAINEQLGMSSRAAHQGVDVAKANIMGGGIASGIEGSGVMAEQGTVADSAATLAMANAARSIADKNRQVKDQAQVALGQYGIGQTNQRYQEALADHASKKGSYDQFWGGVKQMGTEMISNQEDEAWREKVMNAEWFKKLPWDEKQKILVGLRN